MLTKETVHLVLEHFSIDDLVDRILLIQKIESALKESANGEGSDWENLKKEMDTWLD